MIYNIIISFIKQNINISINILILVIVIDKYYLSNISNKKISLYFIYILSFYEKINFIVFYIIKSYIIS